MPLRLAVVVVSALALVAGCGSASVDGSDGAAGADDDLAVTIATDLSPSGPRELARRVPDGAVPRGLGFPCDLPGDCDSGSCIDGYCCESSCDPAVGGNLCKACNVPGHEGRCAFALAGTDPHQQCEPDPTRRRCRARGTGCVTAPVPAVTVRAATAADRARGNHAP